MAAGRAALLLVVAVVLGVVLLQVGSRPVTNPSEASPPTSVPPAKTVAPPPTTTTTLPRSSVHVLVANGLGVDNLATDYSNELQAQGWATLPAVNTMSTVNASAVYYAAGKQAEAAGLASFLGLSASAVQPLTASVPVASVTGADVVVIVGSDLAARAPGANG